MIKITSMKDSFRRCGVAHTKKPQTYDDKRFSAKEIKILESETMLKVETGLKPVSTEQTGLKPVSTTGKGLKSVPAKKK